MESRLPIELSSNSIKAASLPNSPILSFDNAHNLIKVNGRLESTAFGLKNIIRMSTELYYFTLFSKPIWE